MCGPLLLVVFALLSSALLSCKKKDSPARGINKEEVRRKLNNWLSAQYISDHPRKNALLMALKKELVYEDLRNELLNSNEELLLIPLKKSFSRFGQLPAASLLQLLLVVDNNKEIRRGSLVLFKPAGLKTVQELPSNTFYNIFHYGELALDGEFTFFTVAGQWIYQLSYHDGKLNAYSRVSKKTTREKSSVSCTEWQLITTHPRQQSWETVSVSLGRTCGNYCDQDVLPHACVEMEEEAGGWVDPNMQWVANSIAEPVQWHCETERYDPVSGCLMKTCTYTWNYHVNLLLWQSWRLWSREELQLKKTMQGWQIRAIKHKGDSVMGLPPDFVSFTSDIDQVKADLGTDSLSAGIDLGYTVKCVRKDRFKTTQLFHGKSSVTIQLP